MVVASLSLADGAAWATIVGTVIVVVGTILGWLGRLKLRLPAGLSSIESRALFVASIVVIALPIIAWGPLAGILPALANLIILPSMPAYLQDYLRRPKDEKGHGPRPEVRQALAFYLAGVLVAMNVVALGFILDRRVFRSEVSKRIYGTNDCNALNNEFEVALSNYRRAEANKDRYRMSEEHIYMTLAERRMRDRSCPQNPEVPPMPEEP